MKRLIRLCIALLVFVNAEAEPDSSQARVRLAAGDVLGIQTEQCRSFRGIPYAEPPLGDLRWRPPVPKRPWQPRLWDATNFRHNCLQDPSAGFMGWPQPLETLSEDCLYLNVYAPASPPATKVPVMFWIHGGGYVGGGGNETRLNGTWDVALMKSQLAIVTISYRLGVFGFLAADELRDRDPLGGTGNYGLLDQRLAMRWVQDNIASFGGDPQRVLIVGQSAGANSVSQHLVRQKSWGLFSRAGLESGAFYEGWKPKTVQSQRALYLRVLQHAGCCVKDGPACLVAASTTRLLNASLAEGMKFGPVVDGVDLEEPGVELAMQGKLAPVPILVGSVSEDGLDDPVQDVKCSGELCSEADFRFWIKTAFEKKVGRPFSELEVSRLVKLYGDDSLRAGIFTRWYWAMQHAGADEWAGCYARRTAAWATAAGQSAFFYRWTYVPRGPNGAFPSLAHHACEQPFIFHVLAETSKQKAEDGGMYQIDASEVQLSTAVVRYWTSMAAIGAPVGEVQWKPFAKRREGLVIDSEFSMEADLRGAQCDFWDEMFYASRLSSVFV
eukprot:TRINITY_DN28969_c0_g2_i1.p1 TRINITY_DN28969_c0_g2~~TRINITY_DN28969_c0_g2_i1.p1  ORF type:complete len:554 (-),score=61.42 TRINITY_DN28969_c0_g2_i1:239-1900(-)